MKLYWKNEDKRDQYKREYLKEKIEEWYKSLENKYGKDFESWI